MTFWNLSEVPNNIPAEAVDVRLFGNKIREIPNDTFKNLSRCRSLFLYENEISQIDLGAFDGLRVLSLLELHVNKLTSLEPGVFDALRSLRSLTLDRNYLTTLDSSLFSNQPGPLELALSDPHRADCEDWDCNSLCWLKLDEKISWKKLPENVTWIPECKSGLSWNKLKFPGEQCREPSKSNSAVA